MTRKPSQGNGYGLVYEFLVILINDNSFASKHTTILENILSSNLVFKKYVI